MVIPVVSPVNAGTARCAGDLDPLHPVVPSDVVAVRGVLAALVDLDQLEGVVGAAVAGDGVAVRGIARRGAGRLDAHEEVARHDVVGHRAAVHALGQGDPVRRMTDVEATDRDEFHALGAHEVERGPIDDLDLVVAGVLGRADRRRVDQVVGRVVPVATLAGRGPALERVERCLLPQPRRRVLEQCRLDAALVLAEVERRHAPRCAIHPGSATHRRPSVRRDDVRPGDDRLDVGGRAPRLIAEGLEGDLRARARAAAVPAGRDRTLAVDVVGVALDTDGPARRAGAGRELGGGLGDRLEGIARRPAVVRVGAVLAVDIERAAGSTDHGRERGGEQGAGHQDRRDEASGGAMRHGGTLPEVGGRVRDTNRPMAPYLGPVRPNTAGARLSAILPLILVAGDDTGRGRPAHPPSRPRAR